MFTSNLLEQLIILLISPLSFTSFNTSDDLNTISFIEEYKNNNIISEYNNNIQKFSDHEKYPKDTQFVLLQFDGSYSLDMWKKTQDFATEMRLNKKPLRFTYFISGVYFVPENITHVYDLDGYRKGHSDIGWGDDVEDISKRISYVNLAYRNGHEIASHANGHFDGSKWSKKQWVQEFDYFNRFLFPRFDGKYPDLDSFHAELQNKFIFNESEITGFRAPLLGHNDAMFLALQEFGFTYETNKVFMQNRLVDKGDTKNIGNIWNFPLYGVNIGGRNTIAMDYNLYYLQSKGKSTLKRGTPEWNIAYKDSLTGYKNYFYNHYNSSNSEEDIQFKAPVTIGHHFSPWNDGLYWSVMKKFAEEVCGKPKVVCGTGQEYQAFLESWDAEKNTNKITLK